MYIRQTSNEKGIKYPISYKNFHVQNLYIFVVLVCMYVLDYNQCCGLYMYDNNCYYKL